MATSDQATGPCRPIELENFFAVFRLDSLTDFEIDFVDLKMRIPAGTERWIEHAKNSLVSFEMYKIRNF